MKFTIQAQVRTIFVISLALLLPNCATRPVKRTIPFEKPVTKSNSQSTEKPRVTSENIPTLKQVQSNYTRGNYSDALAQIESTPESQLSLQDRSDLWNIRGLILLRQQKHSESTRSFQKALEINPNPSNRPYLQYNLAAAYAEQKKFAEAEVILDAISLSALDSENRTKVLQLREKIERSKINGTASASAFDHVGKTNNGTESGALENTNEIRVTEKYDGPTETKKIGVLVPLTGKFQGFGERVLRSVKLAVEKSENGDQTEPAFEIIAQDAGPDLASHLEALKILVEQHQVIGIIGPILSNGLETLVARAAYYQVPLFSLAQGEGPSAENYFQCSVSPADQVKRVLEYAMNEQGMKKFALIAPENRSGLDLAYLFWNEIEKRGGEIRGFETYPSNETDFRSTVDPILGLSQTEDRKADLDELARLRLQDNITKRTRKTEKYYTLKPIIDFDAAIITDEAKTVGQIIPTFAYRDATGIKWLGISSWNSQNLIQRAGDLVEGAVFPTPLQTFDASAETKEFINLFQATHSIMPTEMDALAYDATQVLKAAMNASPSSRSELTSLIKNQTKIKGATGQINMIDQTCSRDLRLVTIKKSKFVSIK